MRQIVLSILILLIVGCGKNPLSSPPVLHAETFEEHVAIMQTPAHVATWMRDFSIYSDPYEGWAGDDLVYSLAYYLWKNNINGLSRGKCGSFAAMQVLCAREHGRQAGIIVWYSWSADGSACIGHAEAWIKEGKGYSIQSNLTYEKEKYKTYDDMLKDYIRMHVYQYGYLIMYDDHWLHPIEYLWEDNR